MQCDLAGLENIGVFPRMAASLLKHQSEANSKDFLAVENLKMALKEQTFYNIRHVNNRGAWGA